MGKSQRELFPTERGHDPYRDWYQVYRAEVVDKIRSWPVNRKVEAEGNGDSRHLNENIQGVAQ